MNKNLVATALGILLAVVGLSGCESDRAKPPGVSFSPRRQEYALQPEQHLSEAEMLTRAAAQTPSPVGGEGWQPMSGGESSNGWSVTDFSGHGRVEFNKLFLVLHAGDPFTGVRWTNDMPKVNYEIAFEAMRISGSDFFCALTFPASGSFCSLIVGGWGGTLVGLSNLDDRDASENETTQIINFEDGRWYRLRLRVTEQKIEAWIEQKKVVDVVIMGRKISLPGGDIERSKPLGIASWMTTTALREIKIRSVTSPDSPLE